MTGDKHGLGALTEKEKATLRLIVRGHDAKSIATRLGLSVHTINERLRDARRKVAVSSSREAARLLFEAESAATPDSVADNVIGEATAAATADAGDAPPAGAGRRRRLPSTLIGAAMLVAVAAVALAALTPSTTPPPTAAAHPDVVDAARRFLALVDQSRWDESYGMTGAMFHKQNTVAIWSQVSEQVRARFGPMVERTFVSEEEVPAPPHGYELVKFHTRFARQDAAVETVTLDREDGTWRITGVTVE